MGDISTWSPVDESNTAAVPNGWPEGQATNTVNNCARAMMGGVRRWYDTVTAQLAALTTSIAAKVPLAGGTMTGTLSAPSYNLSGVAFAFSDASYHYIYDKDGATASVVLGGIASGNANYYRATSHTIQSNDGVATFATLNAVGLSVPTMVDTTQYKLFNTTLAYRSGDGGHVVNDGGGGIALALYPGISYYRANSHTFQNDAGTAVAWIDNTGTLVAADVSVSGGVTAAGLNSTGGITASTGIITAGNITGNQITGNHLQSNGNIDAAGDIGCNDFGTTGSCTVGTNLAVLGGGSITGTCTAGTFSSNSMIAATLTASAVQCNGNINAASYTRNGVPVFSLTRAQFDAIEARLAILETLAMREPA